MKNISQSAVAKANQYLKAALPQLSSDDIHQLPQWLGGFIEEAEYNKIPLQTITKKIEQLRLPNDPDECYHGKANAFGWYYAWGFAESMGQLREASLAVQLRAYALYLYVLLRDERYDDENSAYLAYRLVKYAVQQPLDKGKAMAEFLNWLLDCCAFEKPDRHTPKADVRSVLRLSVALVAAKFDLVLPVVPFGGHSGLGVYLEHDYLSHYFWDSDYYRSDSWLNLLNQHVAKNHPRFEELEMWLING